LGDHFAGEYYSGLKEDAQSGLALGTTGIKTRKPFNLEIQAKLNGVFKLAFYTEETLYSNLNLSFFVPLYPAALLLLLYLFPELCQKLKC
jgi:hypothetical protein